MEDLLKLIDKHVDQEALVKDLAIQFLLPKLEAFVADTSNPYDDMLVARLKEFLKL